MHSCTTCSGALAPAVIRTVSTSRNRIVLDLGDAIDQERGDSQPVGDLGQPPAVRAVLAPQHEHQVGLGRQVADGFLTILGRVADVVLGGIGDVGELFPERGDHDVGVVDAERGLGQIGDLVRVGDGEPLDVLGGFDQDHLVGSLAHGADDFVVSLVADQDDGVSFSA